MSFTVDMIEWVGHELVTPSIGVDEISGRGPSTVSRPVCRPAGVSPIRLYLGVVVGNTFPDVGGTPPR